MCFDSIDLIFEEKNMRFLAILTIAVATLFVGTAQESQAQFYRGGSGFSISVGNFGGGFGGFNRGYGGFNSFNRGFGGSSFNRGFGGGGFGYSSFRPVYRSYRPVYGGGFNSFGGGFGRGCGY